MEALRVMCVCERVRRPGAVGALVKGRGGGCAAGAGNQCHATDTAAALRAVEMNCDALFKGTQVDGVYSADPKSNPSAKRYEKVTYEETLARDLKVMDGAAIALARDNQMPIIVFSIKAAGAFASVLQGKGKSALDTAAEKAERSSGPRPRRLRAGGKGGE